MARNVYTGAPDSLGPLFDRGRAPHNHSDTSKAAARSQSASLPQKRRAVYDCIARQGPHGMTCDEAERALGMRHTTVSARINELATREPVLVIDSGRRRVTSGGRAAIVWIAVERTEVSE